MLNKSGNALAVLVTNTWFDFKESGTEIQKANYDRVKRKMKTLLSAAGRNSALIHIDLPWESEYGSATRKQGPKNVNKPLYILVVGDQKRVFDFTKRIAEVLEGIIPSDDFHVAMRNLEYEKPIFQDEKKSAVVFPSLELHFFPKYEDCDIWLPSARIIVGECRNLKPIDNAMRYDGSGDQAGDNGFGVPEKAWQASARLAIPYNRDKMNQNPVFGKLTSPGDVRVEVSYCINSDKKDFADLKYDRVDDLKYDQDSKEYRFTINIGANSYSKSGEFPVIVRLSVYANNSSEHLIEDLKRYDSEERQVSASSAWNYSQDHPEFTLGVCDLFIKGWTKISSASTSVLHDGSDESLIQEVYTEFHIKGSIFGVGQDLAAR